MTNNIFNLVLCLAGKGSRFTTKGYKTPKYLLELNDNKTILEHILTELKISKHINLTLIINIENIKWSGKVKSILNNLKLDFKIFHVPDTRGQAHTANIACTKIKNNFPIYFFNGDTIIKNRDLYKISEELRDKNLHGVIDTFFANEDHFSYVNDIDGLVREIKEKIVISNNATTGLYGFINKNTYMYYYERMKEALNEEYISDVYNLMLNEDCRILNKFYQNKKDTIILGTPEEYEEKLNEDKNK